MECNMLWIDFADYAFLYIFSLDSITEEFKVFQIKVSPWPLSKAGAESEEGSLPS